MPKSSGPSSAGSGETGGEPAPSDSRRAAGQSGTLAGAILAAFEQACKTQEYIVAERLLATLEKILAARPDAAGAQSVQLALARTRLRALGRQP
jgi:hypothetical protein